MRQAKANLFLQPIVGPTKADDIDYFTRARSCQAVARHYPPNMMLMSLPPLAMRMAGPREALWHALIAKNYGCTHFVVGHSHASPGNGHKNNAFYEPYASHALIARHQEEIGGEGRAFERDGVGGREVSISSPGGGR
jgi:sulfate adenylyltransferase